MFDGYDDIETFGTNDFLPTSNRGHVIITSRRPEASRFGHAIPLDLFSLEDGIILLLRSSQSLGETTNGIDTLPAQTPPLLTHHRSSTGS